MITRISLLALATALAVAVPTGADHCATYSTSEPEVDVTLPDGQRFYVDNDVCQPGCSFSVWAYCESNGIDGLQRGDESWDDTCHYMIEADGCSGL